MVARQPLLVGEPQHVEEVLGDVVVLLEEEHQAWSKKEMTVLGCVNYTLKAEKALVKKITREESL